MIVGNLTSLTKPVIPSARHTITVGGSPSGISDKTNGVSDYFALIATLMPHFQKDRG